MKMSYEIGSKRLVTFRTAGVFKGWMGENFNKKLNTIGTPDTIVQSSVPYIQPRYGVGNLTDNGGLRVVFSFIK